MKNIQIESNILKKLQIIAKEFNLDLLILFGSRVKNNAKENSDYDLAFYKKYLTVSDEIKLYDKLDSVFKQKKYDFVNLASNHSTVLKREIYLFGILIHGDKKLFEKEKESSFFDYVDSRVLLNPTKEKFLSSEI